jgi:DNA-binding LacI/PurR family transcriptional regulator
VSVATSFVELASISTLAPRERVIETLKEWILTGQLTRGKPLPSERVLAGALGVSRVTVRAALKELFDDGLLTPPAPGEPRRVSDSAASGAAHLMNHTIAMLSEAQPIPETADLPSGWDTFTDRRASQAFGSRGYHVLSLNSQRLVDDGLEQLLSFRPMGLLASHDCGESRDGQRIIEACATHGVPVVISGDSPLLTNYDRVEADHEQGSYELTRWLLARGRRRILRLWRFPSEHEWLNRRDAGFERAMQEAGIDPMPAVRTVDMSTRTADRQEFGHMVRSVAGYLVEHLTGPNPVDAIITATDPHAYQVAGACRLFGKVPNIDVLIAGFDNTWRYEVSRQFEPVGPAVTVDKRNDLIGDALARLLLQRIAGELPPQPQRVLVPTELVEVESFPGQGTEQI